MLERVVKRAAFRFCGLFICVNLICLIIPFSATASQPIVTLDLNNPIASANVEPGETGVALFTGTVECDQRGVGQNVQGVIVTLAASTDLDWPATINPVQMAFRPGETSKPFDVSVTVPPETSVFQVCNLDISGTARPYPGMLVYNVPPASGMIEVEPYMNFMLGYEDESKCSEPGSSEDFKFFILNFGNYDETFNISLAPTNSKEVLEEWDIEFSEDSTEIAEKNTKMISFKVNIPRSASSGKHDITIKVTSTGIAEDQNTIQSMSISFRVDVEWGLLGLGTYPSLALIIILIVICIAMVVAKMKFSRARLRRRITY
jgi:hypothetical protein